MAMRRLIDLVQQAEQPPARPRAADTPEFRRWFGSSRVVHPDGTPRVVYHGTNKPDFEAFRLPGRSGSGGDAIFFASDPGDAAYFARQASGARILPVYVRMERPFDYRDPDHRARFAPFLAKHFGSLCPGALYGVEAALGFLARGDFGILERPPARRWMVRNGFDGFWTGEFRHGATDAFGVFDPAQVKSAVGNKGSFDPHDPRIAEDGQRLAAASAAEAGRRRALAEGVLEVVPVDSLGLLAAPPLPPVKVFRNPSRAEFQAAAPFLAETNHAIRFLVEASSGDLYLWDGMAATHSAVFHGLYLPGDLYRDTYIGHIRPGKGAAPMVELDTANYDPEALRANANLRHILGGRFRVVEID